MDSIRLFHKLLLLSSLEEFTTKMFKFMNKTDYILGEHHKAIFSAIDDVIKEVNGEYTLYAVDKLWDGNTDSNEEIVDVPVTEVESPTKEQMSKTKVIIYWTVKGLKIRNKISDYFKLPLKITVNGETYCEVDDSLIEK